MCANHIWKTKHALRVKNNHMKINKSQNFDLTMKMCITCARSTKINQLCEGEHMTIYKSWGNRIRIYRA